MTSGQSLPTRRLGKTNLQVPILGVGGWHIGEKRDPDLGRRIIRTAVHEGITFLDNAWCYNQGASEWIMGHAADGHLEGYKQE